MVIVLRIYLYMVLTIRNRKGSIEISTILVLVVILFVALALILFLSDPAKKLDIFTTEKNEENLDTLNVGTLALMDSNFVNFDIAAAKTDLKKVVNIVTDSTVTPPIITSIDCTPPATPPPTPLTPDEQKYCDSIDISLSPAPPRYSTTPEGITISVSYPDDTVFENLEGYATITLNDVYEFNQVFASKLDDFPECTTPVTETCFVNTIPITELLVPPVITMTDLSLIVTFDDEASVRMPFYYDNFKPGGIEDEEICTISWPPTTPLPIPPLSYSNIKSPASDTKIQISIDEESPESTYKFTIVHMEKSHEREYAIYCGLSMNTAFSSSQLFPVQVTSGKYDLFRVYGWDPLKTDCISVKDDVLVENGKITYVNMKFRC